MVKGRVYHKGLELEFPDLTIRTYGSVGINDQSVSIMAEMPVPPKWIGNNTIGSALRNQTIRIPIGGTLSKPKIDKRELERQSQQFIGNAARNILEDEGQKLLENLFGRPR
jgi:translocation and assembly module TamB